MNILSVQNFRNNLSKKRLKKYFFEAEDGNISRHQRPRNHSCFNDLKTIEFSGKIGFSADYGKNYNSYEHKTEKFGTSDLENLEIIIVLKNMKKI